MLRLSVEELALLLIHSGQAATGEGIMQTTLGNIEKNDMRSRLLSAGHSLMARGWMTMEKDGKFIFPDFLIRIIRPLTKADFSIRYSKSEGKTEENLSYHFAEGTIFEHKVEQGVIHTISEVATEAVVEEGWRFFDGQETDSFHSSPVEMENGLLEKVMTSPDQKEVVNKLTASGMAEPEADLLAEDIRTSKHRGSALRIEYDKNNFPVSNRGILTLRGLKRMWLMRPRSVNGNAMLTLLPASETAFAKELTALMKD